MEPTNSRALVKLLLTTGLGEIPAMPGEDIGSDPELLAMLTEASVDRANTYAEAQQICESIPEKFIVLVDFDVILAYVQAESERDEFAEIRHFFEYSHLRYGVPAGAYEELLFWLREEYPGLNRFRLKYHDDQGLVKSLLDVLGEKGSVAVDESRVDEAVMTLDRLLRVLTSRRYTQVYSVFDQKFADATNDIMQKPVQKPVHRGKKTVERSKNNLRDARNIAIAYASWQRGGLIAPEQALSVVTSTEKLILLTVTHSNFRVLMALRQQGLPRLILRPRQLFMACVLGVDESAGIARDRSVALGNIYRAMSDKLGFLRKMVSTVGRQQEISEQVMFLLETLWSDQRNASIERVRAHCISMPMFHRFEQGEGFVESVHPRYTSFARLCGRLRGVLGGTSGYVYRVVPWSTKSHFVVKRVFYDAGYSGESDSSYLLEVRVHPLVYGFPVYQLQWNIDVDELALFECLGLCHYRFGGCEDDHLVVVTRGGRFKFSAQEVNVAGGLGAMSLLKLQQLVRKAGEKASDRICELEVVLGCFHIVFDVIPPDHTWGRRLTVTFFSRPEIKFIRVLYEWTGDAIIMVGPFEAALSENLL